MSWFRPRGSLADDSGPVALDPTGAGWEYCGLRVVDLEPGTTAPIDLGGTEALVVPLSGACLVELDSGEAFDLVGRASVFSAVSGVLYLPPDTRARLSTPTGGEFAVATAMTGDTAAGSTSEPIHRPAAAVAVEVRGAGPATRQVNQLLPAEQPGPHRLIVVEVLTPGGNWSSYPPHKHDESTADEAALEEIYYFRVAREDGFGLHRTYTADGVIDDTVTVRTGDVYLVHRGYHGPCVAAPGYDLYYLNVMAGPERRWSISFDPTHEWVVGSWAGQPADPRVPMTTPDHMTTDERKRRA